MLRLDTADERPFRTKASASKRPPLGGRKRQALERRERRELEKRVMGGEDDFRDSLITPKEKSKRKKRRTAAELNAPSRKPVWEDSDDEDNTAKFEKLTGTPKWAKIDAEKPKDDDSDLEELARSTGTHLVSSASLAPGYLHLKRCPDGNSDNPNTGKLTSVRFHQTAQILMTASTDRSVRLFQVDGKNNKSLQNVFLDNFPVMSAEFIPGQQEIIMGSKHRGFYFYDMMAGKVVLVPRIRGLEENNMARVQVTPDGKLLVFLGQYGNIHLLSAKSKEWIHTLHMNGGVSDVSFTSDGTTMFATGDDGRICVFDLTTRRCVHSFFDDGCVRGTAIALAGTYLACGSNTGVVNVYDRAGCMASDNPRPLKAIMNLTTSCTSAVFSPSADILALASNLTEKAVKLVHLPSCSVFANFPEMNDTKIRIPWTMDFSPHGGYFCIGNQKGHALLYRVKHYSSY